MARIEGSLDWLKVLVAVFIGVLGLLATTVVFVGVQVSRVDGKVDRLAEKVDGLPARISAELRDINQTLAAVLTAARQTPPQVILMPAPQLPPPAPTP